MTQAPAETSGGQRAAAGSLGDVEPLSRETLVGILAARLEERILSGDLEVGARLPSEGVIAREFGVSRPVVRESLAQLRERGLVETTTGSGTFVRVPGSAQLADAFLRHLRFSTLDAQAIENLYEARRAIETMTARLAAERSIGHDVDEIRERLSEMTRSVRDGERWAAADVAFHLAVATASHNPFLAAYLAPLVTVMTSVIVDLRRVAPAPRTAIAQHEAILRRIERGDGDGAADAMRKHLRISQRELLSLFPDTQGGRGRLR